MPTVPIHNQQGEETGTLELHPMVFGVPAKAAVLHQVVVAQQANARRVLAHTKTRGEVRGGGRKPWQQKGTGRARHGSIRSPLWVGGGKVFGPRANVNFTKKVNAKVRRHAVRMALSDKVAHADLIVLDAFAPAEAKTAAARRVLDAVLRDRTGTRRPSILMILADRERSARRGFQNLPRVDGIDATHLNALDILAHDVCIATVAAVERMTNALAPTPRTARAPRTMTGGAVRASVV